MSDPMVHLPNLRKDARANVEAVLHEIIADNAATIPEICARTGMALRTINNAIATLRDAGIIQSGDIKGRAKSKVKGQEVGPKDVKVSPKVDFDILMPDARKDFKETCRQVWELLVLNETLRQIEVSERLKIAHSTVKSVYAALKDAGLLNKEGEGRGSKWIVVHPSRLTAKEGCDGRICQVLRGDDIQ